MRYDFIVTNNLATQELVRQQSETVGKLRVSASEYMKASQQMAEVAAQNLALADRLEGMNAVLMKMSEDDFLFGDDTANTKAVSDHASETIDDGAPIPAFLGKKQGDTK